MMQMRSIGVSALDRANAVLHRDAPEEIDRFNFVQRQHGIALVEQQVDRDSLGDSNKRNRCHRAQQRDAVVMRAVDQGESASEPAQDRLYQVRRSIFSLSRDSILKYSLGGPDGFILYQITAEGTGQAAAER